MPVVTALAAGTRNPAFIVEPVLRVAVAAPYPAHMIPVVNTFVAVTGHARVDVNPVGESPVQPRIY